MKTENMKLLDLQTDKYLELGEKGFFYGGKIITCPPTKSFDIQNVDREMILHIYAYTEKDYDIKCLDDSLCPLFEITLKSNNQKLIGREVGHIDMRFNRVIEQTEPPLELKEICEKTGAIVYGGRYVLLNEIFYIEGVEHKYSDVFRFYINKKGDYMVDYRAINCQALNCKFDKDNKIIKLGNTKIIKIEYIGNPFEEYSKQLRNEPNKFDELNEHFK